MTMKQLVAHTPEGYSIKHIPTDEGYTIGLFQEDKLVTKIGAFSEQAALSGMKDWLILSQLWT
jgi:hypothetical protein